MDTVERSGKESMPDLSEVIEKIMANPQLISAVASALGKSPAPKDSEEPPAPEPKAEPTSASPSPDLQKALTLLPILSGLQSGGVKPPDNDRTRLLCALKPYVNPHRKETIDTLLRFSGMTELLKLLHPNE